MLPDWLESELAAVPCIDAFCTADEMSARMEGLAAEHSYVAELRRVGTSRLGDPLTCLTIGTGGADALVFGLPHPNEPIGGLTALHLARRLCEDADLRRRLGHRWHIIACIDPDGLRLNEGWLKGPFTREHYARHFYRPAENEQVEWTFPIAYKQAYFDAVLPETLALMRLIDEHAPALMCSLHNSELGGVYYYLSRPQPALHGLLQQIPERLGLPLDRGEPEAPWLRRFADGIFEMLDARRDYDERESLGEDMAGRSGGNSSASYAARYGTLTLLSEVPYWMDARVGDASLTTTTYAAAIEAQAARLDELAELMTGTLSRVADEVVTDSAFLRASRYFAPSMASAARAAWQRAAEDASRRPATVAELVSVQDVTHSFRLRFAGMLLRALDGELAVGNVTAAIRRERRTLAHRYADYVAEAEASSAAEAIPIRKLVATQYAALVATASQLADRRINSSTARH